MIFFAAEAVSLIAAAEAWHCACRIKSICCKDGVCPMDAAPRNGTSFASCGGSDDSRFVPMFLSWRAIVPETIVDIASPRAMHKYETTIARPLDGEHAVPEHPPRASALVIA